MRRLEKLLAWSFSLWTGFCSENLANSNSVRHSKERRRKFSLTLLFKIQVFNILLLTFSYVPPRFVSECSVHYATASRAAVKWLISDESLGHIFMDQRSWSEQNTRQRKKYFSLRHFFVSKQTPIRSNFWDSFLECYRIIKMLGFWFIVILHIQVLRYQINQMATWVTSTPKFDC